MAVRLVLISRGEIGRLEMAETDKAIAALCEENNIKVDVSKRYVDDLTKSMGSIS